MQRIDAKRESDERICDEVAAVVFDGGTVIFPTDTVYGIGCDPFRTSSVERVFALKARPVTKPLSLHLATVAEFLEYATGNTLATLAARRFLPGPLTIVVQRLPFLDERLTAGLPTMGLRVPNHQLCTAILERCGPLAATSANISGTPAYKGEGLAERLPTVDLFVDAGPTPLRAESTVLDLSHQDPRLIREGAITLEMLEQQLGRIARPLYSATGEFGR